MDCWAKFAWWMNNKYVKDGVLPSVAADCDRAARNIAVGMFGVATIMLGEAVEFGCESGRHKTAREAARFLLEQAGLWVDR